MRWLPLDAASWPDIQRRIAANGTLSAQACRSLQFPWVGPEAEIGCGQCAYRANIGRVAGPVGIKTGIGVSNNLDPPTAMEKPDHRIVGDFPGNARSDRIGCSVHGPDKSTRPTAHVLPGASFRHTNNGFPPVQKPW